MEEERKRREGSAYNRSPIMGEGLRILRLAESLRLGPETLERIRNKLFGEVGQSVSKVEASQVTIEQPSEYPSRYPEVERIDDAEIERLTKAFAKNQPDIGGVQRPGATVIKPVPPAVPQAELKASAATVEIKAAAATSLDLAKQIKAALSPAVPEVKAPAPAPVAAEVKLSPHSHSYASAQEETKKSIDAAIAARKAAPVPQKSPVDDFVEAEILLRKKIEGVQNWAGFKADAWRLYERFPRPDTAGRLVELALMYGNANDLEEVLVHLNRQSIDYYALLQNQTRSHVLTKLWQAKRHDFLDGFLFRKDFVLKQNPLERWYCIWSMIDRGQSEQAFRWFKRNDNEIWNTQKQYGSTFSKSETELAYALGHAALKAEDEALSIRLLETIPQTAPEFGKAIDLLLDLRVERDEKGYCVYGQKLSRELDWKARVGLFDSFLLRIQRLEHLAPKDRAALNALLADPLRWFPETPEAWQLVSEMLLQFAGLEKLLPNILKTFSDRATQYYKPPFEHALWAPVLDHDFRNPVKTWYWRSIALLHEFAWGLGQDEKKLWESRHLFHEALEHEGKTLPYTWQQIHRGLTQWISKSERMEESARVRLLLMAKLCGETREVSEEDVTTYLTHVQQPSSEVLDTLETLARERQQWGLELFVQGRKANLFHHTNGSLSRVWELASMLKRNDLCWRAATLLSARQVLSPDVEKHWAICGEKRRDFPILMLGDTHLKRILQTFEGYERRLIESIVTIGPLVPELLAGLNEHLVPLKKGKPLTKTESSVQEALDKMSWLIPARKHFSPNPNGLWQAKPVFFSNLVDSKWSVIFVGLAQRFGITAWDWQLSLLNQQIETLVPRMSRTSDSVAAGKVGRWLRALTPQQRKAWYELAQMSKRFDDLKAQEILGRFLVILSTSMHQDHLSALQNLERMRAPLRLRWDLENWIGSDAYGEIRKSLGSHAVGHFPDDVYRLPVLVQEQGKSKK
jgi:hypothetical protein